MTFTMRGDTLATTSVCIPAEAVSLAGDLTLPPHPLGIVLFAHGSGSSRLSPRNQRVAAVLQRGGFATLLFDLLTEEEEALDAVSGEYRFDIPLLARRLITVTDWIHDRHDTRPLRIGYFGASTGAAAALVAAAERRALVGAVVSRGGRPDLARKHLAQVAAATLLIVGERDQEVVALNLGAQRHMQTKCQVRMVRGATHLFEEPGALEEVAQLAESWFAHHLVAGADSGHRAPVFVAR